MALFRGILKFILTGILLSTSEANEDNSTTSDTSDSVALTTIYNHSNISDENVTLLPNQNAEPEIETSPLGTTIRPLSSPQSHSTTILNSHVESAISATLEAGTLPPRIESSTIHVSTVAAETQSDAPQAASTVQASTTATTTREPTTGTSGTTATPSTTFGAPSTTASTPAPPTSSITTAAAVTTTTTHATTTTEPTTCLENLLTSTAPPALQRESEATPRVATTTQSIPDASTTLSSVVTLLTTHTTENSGPHGTPSVEEATTRAQASSQSIAGVSDILTRAIEVTTENVNLITEASSHSSSFSPPENSTSFVVSPDDTPENATYNSTTVEPLNYTTGRPENKTACELPDKLTESEKQEFLSMYSRNVTLIVVIMILLNIMSLAIAVFIFTRIVKRSYRWDRPPSRCGSKRQYFLPKHPAATVASCTIVSGRNLASDVECQEGEPHQESVPVITKDAGWCVPLSEDQKKSNQDKNQKIEEDTGV